MPKLFDEFDLDLQKIGGVELYSTDGGNSVAICDATSGTSLCTYTDNGECNR